MAEVLVWITADLTEYEYDWDISKWMVGEMISTVDDVWRCKIFFKMDKFWQFQKFFKLDSFCSNFESFPMLFEVD